MRKCVHTKRGVKSTHFIKCVERVFCLKCSLWCVYWGYLSVWIMCGKGIIFIDTFYPPGVAPIGLPTHKVPAESQQSLSKNRLFLTLLQQVRVRFLTWVDGVTLYESQGTDW